MRAGARARQPLGPRRARSSPASTCTTTTTSSGPSVELKTQQGACRAVQRRATTRSTTTPGTTSQNGRRRRSYAGGPDRRARRAVRDRAGDDQLHAGSASGPLFTLEAVSARRPEPRVPRSWRASYDLQFSDYEGAARRRRRRRTACSFAAMPSSAAVPPARARRRSRSCRARRRRSSSGPAGEEIYTDKYGRVKVQFHWDRCGKKDENSSCWIRVSHAVGRQELGRDVASRASARR